MGQRLQLHELFLAMTQHVYYQPPENIGMQFPCIMYSRDGDTLAHAGNQTYRSTRRYQVTVIDPNPDSDLPDAVEKLPMCHFERWYAADSLNHYVFSLFF